MAPKKKVVDKTETISPGVILTDKQIKADFDKRFGEGSIFTFEDNNEPISVFPIPTGIPSIDYASGIGGLPLGRVVEIYGPESAGKTSVALATVSQAQRISRDISSSPIYGRKILYIDAENALDKIHMKNLGCDLSNIMISQPDHAEQALDMVEAGCLSRQFSVIVVDSVPALVPKRMLEGSNEDQHMGVLAKALSIGVSKIIKPANESDTLVIFINQIREKMGFSPTGNAIETTPGGRALRFYSSMRIDIRRKEIKKGDVSVGQATTVRFKKNKLSAPFTVAEYDYMWDGGVDLIKNIMSVAIDMNIIKRAGAYYFYGEDKDNPLTDGNGNALKWMGKESVEAVLKASPALYSYTNDIVQGHIPKDAVFVEESTEEEQESLTTTEEMLPI